MCTAKLFVMCIVVCITDVCQAQTVPKAEYCEQNVVLSTNKAIYQQEETLKAACVLPSSCYRYVDDVILQLADRTLPVADTIIGNTTITLTSVHTIQAGDAGKRIRCVINSQGTASAPLSAQEALTVAEPPSPVDKIKCIVFSYQSMNCSFWPEHQNTGIPTTYDIYYQHQFFQKIFPPDNFRPCPNQKGNTCMFSGTNFYRLGYYAIFVLARNELGNANKTAVFDAAHIVKLERISTLSVSHKGKTRLDLSWQKPYPDHILENTTYEITVHSSADPRPAKMRNITSDSTYLAFSVTDLIPYIQYTVRVRSFPWSYSRGRLEYGGYWSDPAIMKVRTLADVPGAAPNVTVGGFLYYRIANRLDLHWQPVHFHLIHGEPMHYRIRLFKRSPDEDPSCDGENPEVWKITPSSFSTNQTVHLQGPFDVCIDLANHIGYNESLHLTAIRISKEGLPVPKFYTRLSQDDQVEVRILEDTNATRYTLFWCKSFLISCLDKELHWMLVDSSETTPKIATDLPVRNLAVALSAEYITNNEYYISSGMKYATHLFRNAFLPIQMPHDLRSINSKAGSATIQWKKPNKVDTVYIDHFTVDYCLKDNCIDPGKHKQVNFEIQGDLDGTQQTVSLFDLAEEQTYKIRVRSDGDGKNSNYTDPIEVMVQKSGLSKTWKIVLAVIGAVTVIPVLGIVYTVIRKCRRKVVEYNRPLDVIIPTVDEQLQEQNGQTTRSADQYTDVADDGYEKIQECQSDNRQQEQQQAANTPSGTSEGKVNAGAQPEEIALLDKQENGHVTPLCSDNSEYRGSAIP